jgi:hypothetical protein
VEAKLISPSILKSSSIRVKSQLILQITFYSFHLSYIISEVGEFFHSVGVIPAKAGIQKSFAENWMPAWRGHDGKTPRSLILIKNTAKNFVIG